ncbi:hypothetical protein B0H17DRAFT_1195684 [Mycena rosella]|uniref:Uncharacterized protein n=1 Tax=Mycena rosella TaxID=1033263 RepID=A0AAD7GQ92_MYCRO|nr:hypothetical protein B0H17DRAFT_1195684 [Mycena rosella]
MSIASSKTLSLQSSQCDDPTEIPYDLVDLILSHTIGQVIHDAVEAALLPGQSIIHSILPSWTFIGDLAGVSTNFRAIVLKLLALAFRILLPCDSKSIFLEGYKKFRSLLLFKAATLAGAVMDPPAVWHSPLMQAYGHYIKATHRGRALHHSVAQGRRSQICMALSLCVDTVVGLSQPVVDALGLELQAALAAEAD